VGTEGPWTDESVATLAAATPHLTG
jgi:hypothetical protein